MKFLIFNIVTGGALVYLVLAGGPPNSPIEGTGPVGTASASASADPVPPESSAVRPGPKPFTPPVVSDAPIEPDPTPVPEGADESEPVPVPVLTQEENVVVAPQPAMMSPSERSRMLRDLARDMEAKFLQRN